MKKKTHKPQTNISLLYAICIVGLFVLAVILMNFAKSKTSNNTSQHNRTVTLADVNKERYPGINFADQEIVLETIDDTSGWQSYSSPEVMKFSIKYPLTWKSSDWSWTDTQVGFCDSQLCQDYSLIVMLITDKNLADIVNDIDICAKKPECIIVDKSKMPTLAPFKLGGHQGFALYGNNFSQSENRLSAYLLIEDRLYRFLFDLNDPIHRQIIQSFKPLP